MKLTNKQERFIAEYLIDLNATQAAIRSGYSEKTAEAQASRLLINVKIQHKIQQAMKKREQRTEVTQDKVVAELAKIAFTNSTDVVKVEEKAYTDTIVNPETGEPEEVEKFYTTVAIKSTERTSKETQAAIAGIKQGANGIEVKMHDKVKALELLGRHLGMFNDKLEVHGAIPVVIRDDLDG